MMLRVSSRSISERLGRICGVWQLEMQNLGWDATLERSSEDGAWVARFSQQQHDSGEFTQRSIVLRPAKENDGRVEVAIGPAPISMVHLFDHYHNDEDAAASRGLFSILVSERPLQILHAGDMTTPKDPTTRGRVGFTVGAMDIEGGLLDLMRSVSPVSAATKKANANQSKAQRAWALLCQRRHAAAQSS